MIDANLNNSTSDNFTVAGSATGTLEVSKINVTDNSSSNTGYITLFNNTKAPTLKFISSNIYIRWILFF
jgi:hypothetical protein